MDRPMKDEISQITLDCMLGIREGVGKVRTKEFASYIKTLIAAKAGQLEIAAIPWPMLTDRVRQSVDAALSATAKSGVSGGVEWSFINLSGSTEQQKQQGIRVQVEMEFLSSGAPDLTVLQKMPVNELQQMLEVVEPSTAKSVADTD